MQAVRIKINRALRVLVLCLASRRREASVHCGRSALPITLAVWLAAVCIGCDSPDGPTSGDCATRSLAKELKRVLYWGEETPDQWVANGGVYALGDVWWPLWYADDKILVYTRTVERGVDIRGVFEVAIDPQTYSYRSFQPLSFPHPIRGFDFDPRTGDFLVSYFMPPTEIHLVRARAEGATLAIADTVLSPSWYPEVSNFVGDGGGVLSYARDPNSLVWGFYFISNDVSTPDSLLHSIQFTYLSDARGFDVAGGTLCFAETDADVYKTAIKIITLDGEQAPRTVATLDGAFVSARLNQSGTCAVVVQEDARLPGNVVGVLQLETGQFTTVDCQINRCFFPIATFGTWNPIGTAFAFSGGGFNSEGGLMPTQLWIRKDAVCP